jgi:hypothetical protein
MKEMLLWLLLYLPFCVGFLSYRRAIVTRGAHEVTKWVSLKAESSPPKPDLPLDGLSRDQLYLRVLYLESQQQLQQQSKDLRDSLRSDLTNLTSEIKNLKVDMDSKFAQSKVDMDLKFTNVDTKLTSIDSRVSSLGIVYTAIPVFASGILSFLLTRVDWSSLKIK